MNAQEIKGFLSAFPKTVVNTFFIYPTLYKKNNNGKILIWYLERDGFNYRTVSGHLETKNTTVSAWTTAKPKNIGKKNETTAIDQANLECLAKYENKLTKGSYTINIADVDKQSYIKPMLAEIYYSETCDPETNIVRKKSNIPSTKLFNEGYIMQPKLDGIRCIITKDGAFSRKGDQILGVPHVIRDLDFFFKENPDVILDGEIYNHNLEFNVLNGTVRRNPKEDTAGQQLIRKSLAYCVYDTINDLDYVERVELLGKYFEQYNFIYLKNVTDLNIRVNNEAQVDNTHQIFIDQGFEGGILRRLNSKYEHKRSKNLLKVKQFTDAEFIILDVVEGVGNNKGMAAKIKINRDGVDIFPNMTGSWEFCKTILEEKEEYIGGEVTVKYFGVTKDGSLRHPSVKTIYKTKRDM
jgi:DNA ligase 1